MVLACIGTSMCGPLSCNVNVKLISVSFEQKLSCFFGKEKQMVVKCDVYVSFYCDSDFKVKDRSREKNTTVTSLLLLTDK